MLSCKTCLELLLWQPEPNENRSLHAAENTFVSDIEKDEVKKICLSTWKRSLNNSRRKLLGCTTKSPCKVNLSQTKSRKILKVQTKESETTVRRKLWEGEPPFGFWLRAPKLATRRFDASGSYSTPSRSSSTFLSFCLILENIELTWQGADFFSMFRRMFHRFLWNIANFTNFLKSITNQLSSLTLK